MEFRGRTGIMRAKKLALTVATLVLLSASAVQAQIAHGYSNVFTLDSFQQIVAEMPNHVGGGRP